MHHLRMQLTTLGRRKHSGMQHTWAALPVLLVTFTCNVSGAPCTELPDLAVSVVSRLLPAVRSATLYMAGRMLYPMMGLTASGLLLRSCCTFCAPLVSLLPCSIFTTIQSHKASQLIVDQVPTSRNPAACIVRSVL